MLWHAMVLYSVELHVHTFTMYVHYVTIQETMYMYIMYS